MTPTTAEPTFKPLDIARRYRIDVERVLSMIRRGELEAIDVSTGAGLRPRWVITAQALAKFENRKSNRPTPEPTPEPAPRPSRSKKAQRESWYRE